MTVLDDVKRLALRLSPNPICDDCIANELGLSLRQHANHKTRELARLSNFERRTAVCSICEKTKLVVRRI